jgi:hypothetical protein
MIGYARFELRRDRGWKRGLGRSEQVCRLQHGFYDVVDALLIVKYRLESREHHSVDRTAA